MIIIAFALAWHVLVFLKMPHLTWIPAFMNTWFYDKGLLYYKDFIQLHFPIPHMVAYPLLKLTNWDILKEPFLALFTAILTTLILYKIAQKYLAPPSRTAVLVFFSLLFWYSSTWVQYSGESITGLFLLITVFLLIRLANPFLIGIFFSLTELTGQIVTPTLIALFILYTIRLFTAPKTKPFKSLIYFLLGSLVPIAITSAYFFLKGTFTDFFFWTVTYYLTYAKLAKAGIGSLPWKDIVLVFSPALFVLVALIRKKKRDWISLVLVTAIFSSIPFVVGSIFHPHHYLFILPVASLAFGKAMGTDRSRLLIGFFIYMTVFTFYPWYSYRLTRGPANQNLNDVSKDPQMQELVGEIKQKSQSKGIIVVGDPLIYYFSDTLPTNKYFMALPWHYIPLTETKKIFDSKPPHLWIIDTGYMKRFYESWKTPEVGNFIKDQISGCYRKVYESQPWEIWQRKSSCSSRSE